MKRRKFVTYSLLAGPSAFLAPGILHAYPQSGEDFRVPPPQGAVVLFDGNKLDEWLCRKGGPAKWKIEDGYAEVIPGNGDIYTKIKFTDFQLHVEFWLPLMPDATGQERSNSGVYLQGLYEVQVLDSYGLASKNNDCGAIYEVAPPLRNASKRPEQWQFYDIAFRAPRFDENGLLKDKAIVTVFQNGILIHHAQQIPAPTRAHMEVDPKKPGPIMLQDHGNPVRYRNVWIVPIAPPNTA